MCFEFHFRKCSETILCHERQFIIYVLPVFLHIGVQGSRKTCHRVVRFSIWLISHSRALQPSVC